MSVGLAMAGASIFLLLGVAHAVLSLRSRPDAGPLMPTSPVVREAMAQIGGLGMAPDIETSLYRAWIGFNLSHAVGVIAIGATVASQILIDFNQATTEVWFLALVIAAPAIYWVLALKYWFDKPRNAIAIATVLLWAGVANELL